MIIFLPKTLNVSTLLKQITHYPCFEAKILYQKENKYSFKCQVDNRKVGCSGVYFTETCYSVFLKKNKFQGENTAVIQTLSYLGH